jgi:uncharacterized protein (TIGR00251 family)
MESKSPTDTIVHAVGNGVELHINVLPRSSRNAVVGFQDNCLKIKITKPPVDGQANAACCRLLSELFNIPASKVTVVRGHSSRRKTVRLEGLSPAEAGKVLERLVQG